MANPPIVRHISESFIRPKHEVQDAKTPIHLPPGDLVLVTGHCIQRGLLFSNKPESITTLLTNLKLSLSLTLDHFYPLAGQLETEINENQHTSSVFIDCNKGPGARFVHATLDTKISEILKPQYVPRVVHSLFDDDRAVSEHGRPLLSIQVTELADGVFIGVSMNHVCGDGTSYWHFFNTLSEVFNGGQEKSSIVISKPPVHKRWFLDGISTKIKLPLIIPSESLLIERLDPPNLRERIFHFSADSISKLKAKANQLVTGSHKMISSFQALSALVWRCIIRSRRSSHELRTRCRLAVNNRGRLNPPLSSNYFGNAIQVVHGECTVGELLTQNLGFAALKLRKAIEEHNDEKVRNWAKSWMESPYFIRTPKPIDLNSVFIGSSPRFEMYGNEFGMGKALAVLSGCANKYDGRLISLPGREGGGSIDLEIVLSPESMSAIESDEEFMEAVSS